MNNRRVSGCLHDIEAHAGQDLRSSGSAGPFSIGFYRLPRAAPGLVSATVPLPVLVRILSSPGSSRCLCKQEGVPEALPLLKLCALWCISKC